MAIDNRRNPRMAEDAPAPRRTSDYRWQGQQGGASAPSTPGSRRRVWIITLAGIFLALFSIVFLWVLLVRLAAPPPEFLTIHINERDDRLFPPLPASKRDTDLILRHFPPKKQPETKSKNLLRSELSALAKRAANESLVLHLAALAVVRDKKVYVIPGDALADDESTWLDVTEVLSAVRDCKAKNKCLILDLAHELTDPRLGVLSNRVSDTLETILTSEKPAYSVLCPCSAGQVALTSDALQGSVFAYYLDQGLQGNADANKDREVTIKELASFLEARVDRWARENRGLRQKPHLFFHGNDFAVASIGPDSPGPAESAELDAYPDRLQKAWETRDALRDKAISRAPRYLRKLEANLLRQEKLWRGGANQKLDWKALDEEARTLLADLPIAISEPNAPPRALALALAQGEPKDHQALLDSVLISLANVKDATKKADINDKVEEELLKKFQDQKGVEFARHASTVVEALSQIPQLKPDDVRVGRKVLATLKPRERFVELYYLDRLNDFSERLKTKDAEIWSWQADKIQMLLQAMRSHQALLAALNREPGLLPWLAGAVVEGDQLRQAGERKLLWDRPSTWKEGLAELQSAKKKYDEALQTYETLRRGRRDLDRAYAELPGFARLVCDWPDFDPLAEQAWRRAAGEAKKLQVYFIDPPAIDAKGRRDSGPSYQSPFPELDKVLKRRIDAVLLGEDAETLQHIHCLLELPLLKAAERASLLKKQKALAGKLHEATALMDAEDNELRRVQSLPDARRREGEASLGLIRARMALERMRLAGFESKDRLVLPGDGEMNAQEWTRVERALREVQATELRAALRAAKSLRHADALNRVVSPWESEGREELEREPSRRFQQKQRADFFQWLHARYQAEAQFLGANALDQAVSAFYQEAARELRNKTAGVE
jgi:hypothetical protein